MSGLSTKESMTATKAQLREEIRQLRSVGIQMANVCYNWGQRSFVEIRDSDCKMLKDLQCQWDAIERSERAK
jgi:hypothetical protein